MLNKKKCFFGCSAMIYFVIVFCGIMAVSNSYTLNTKILNILSLIESKEYSSASRLLEKEINSSKNHKTNGYYALLLSQLPLDTPMKKARHEYSFMAARWAENIPSKKRMQLWIEAGDGFFKIGELEKSDNMYEQAFLIALADKLQSEIVYILYKRAWVRINNKKWTSAFRFLKQTLSWKKSQLEENILSDMGQIWVESQYFKNNIPFKELEDGVQLVSLERQEIIIKGIMKGMNRIKKKGVAKLIPLLSKNQSLSTRVLNHVLSKEDSLLAPPCHFLPWIETAKIEKLNKGKALSVLNACTKTLLSKKRKKKKQESPLKRIMGLYAQIERKGVERWPLVLIYEYVGESNKACSESLHQLVETADNTKEKIKGIGMKETLMETARLCKEVKNSSPYFQEAVQTLLSSSNVIKNYKSVEGEWESALFHILDKDIFYPGVQKNMLTFDKQWRGKDLLPMLLLSHIKGYKPEEIKRFMNIYSPKPLESRYLDILISADFLTVTELQEWLPLAHVDSYRKVVPWFKKMISDDLAPEQMQIVMAKLLKHFPSDKKDIKDASSFLALHYLKTEQMSEIFRSWDRIHSAFDEKSLAVELFEKSFDKREKTCQELKSLSVSQRGKSYTLLRFMNQCCQVIINEESAFIEGFKLPPALRFSDLAGDFIFLVRIQNKTLQLEKNISQLKDKTSKMIMNLKSSITKYQKRKWRLEAAAIKSEALLQKQIDLFERELTKLAMASPYGGRYKELKKIVSQWR